MKIVYGLVGASGNGSEIMPLIIDNIKKKAKASDDVNFFFIDSNPKKKELNSIRVVSEDDFFSFKVINLFQYLHSRFKNKRSCC